MFVKLQPNRSHTSGCKPDVHQYGGSRIPSCTGRRGSWGQRRMSEALHRCAESAPPLPLCEPLGQEVHHQEAGGGEGGGVTASVLLKPLAAASGELTGSPGVNTCFQSDSSPRRDVRSKKQPRLRLNNSSDGTWRSPQPGQETHVGKHPVCSAKNLIYKCDGGAGGMWSTPPFQHRTF